MVLWLGNLRKGQACPCMLYILEDLNYHSNMNDCRVQVHCINSKDSATPKRRITPICHNEMRKKVIPSNCSIHLWRHNLSEYCSNYSSMHKAKKILRTRTWPCEYSSVEDIWCSIGVPLGSPAAVGWKRVHSHSHSHSRWSREAARKAGTFRPPPYHLIAVPFLMLVRYC